MDSGTESSPRNGGKVASFRQRVVVPVVFLVFVLFRAMDKAFLNRVYKIMDKYGDTLMSLYWPLCIEIMTVFMVTGFVLVQRHRGNMQYNLAWLSPWSPDASSAGAIPWWWMALFAGYDQLNAVVQTMAQPFIPASLQSPINNTCVVFTAVLAYFWLGSRFSHVHYAGCVLIVLSCVTGVIVELQQGTLPDPKDANGHDVHNIPVGTLALMYMIYIAGVIPAALSNCYKQKCLKSVDLDIMWAWLWAATWQVLWGVIFYTINWIPYPLPHTPGSIDPATNASIPDHNTQSPKTLGQDLADSWTCFSGTNPVGSGVTSCSSEPAWVYFTIYLGFNLVFNLLLLWLTKYLSATWATIGTVLCGNLYGVFNQWTLIGGQGHEIMSAEQWLALILSSVAMWVYNIEDERNVDGKSMYGVDADATRPRAGGDAHDGECDGLLSGERLAMPHDDYERLAEEGPSPAQSRHPSQRSPSPAV